MKKLVFLMLVTLMVLSLSFCSKRTEKAEEPAGPDYKIGIAFDIGGRGDQSFNDSAYRGLVMLAEEFKGYIKDDPDQVDKGNKNRAEVSRTQARWAGQGDTPQGLGGRRVQFGYRGRFSLYRCAYKGRS